MSELDSYIDESLREHELRSRFVTVKSLLFVARQENSSPRSYMVRSLRLLYRWRRYLEVVKENYWNLIAIIEAGLERDDVEFVRDYAADGVRILDVILDDL